MTGNALERAGTLRHTQTRRICRAVRAPFCTRLDDLDCGMACTQRTYVKAGLPRADGKTPTARIAHRRRTLTPPRTTYREISRQRTPRSATSATRMSCYSWLSTWVVQYVGETIFSVTGWWLLFNGGSLHRGWWVAAGVDTALGCSARVPEAATPPRAVARARGGSGASYVS